MLNITNCVIKTNNWQIKLPDIMVDKGELLVITGPSGLGKSTLLHWLLGDKISHANITGNVTLNDQLVSALKIEERRIGLLMQDVYLFPHLNVLENICFALPASLKKTQNKAQRKEEAMSYLNKIDLAYLAEHSPAQLSGGERSRVGLVRALANKPQALLMDEPFAALDPDTREQVSHWALGELREQGVPSIMVSHDLDNLPNKAQHLELSRFFERLG
jgi:putative thiamine transport system ATP-binding protein